MKISDSIVEQNQAIRLEAYKQRYEKWTYPEPRLTIVEGAFLLPQTSQTVDHDFKGLVRSDYLVFNSGVYDASGLIVREALHQAITRNVPDHFVCPDSCEQLDGSWLYGGLLMRHIGHMLTESTGRLWAFDKTSVDGIVFIGMNGPPRLQDGVTLDDYVRGSTNTTLREGLIQQVLEIFGVNVPFRIVDRPMRAERLIIPTQLMGLLPIGDLIGGHPSYRAYVRCRVDLLLSRNVRTNLKIYVSRSSFRKPGAAEIFMEDRLDSLFARAGYLVVHPERHRLKDQLQMFSGATHIVMAAGSAVHIAALAMNGSQNVLVYQRDMLRREIFPRQLELMGARSASWLNALCGVFWPVLDGERAKYRAHSNGIFDIDVDKLSTALVDLAFISEPFHEVAGEHERNSRISNLCKSLEQEYGCQFSLTAL